MTRRRFTLALPLIALAGWRPGPAAAQSRRPGAPAPDVAGGPWINSPPLTMPGLRGQVVLVEFWTYG